MRRGTQATQVQTYNAASGDSIRNAPDELVRSAESDLNRSQLVTKDKNTHHTNS